MSAAGPELPPHLLAKRKRQEEEESKDASATASGANRMGSPGEGEKRRRVIGPAMPPAPLEERPAEPAIGADEAESDDDDFGPALPPADSASATNLGDDNDAEQTQSATTTAPAKVERDAWMTMPPKQDDLAARMDPTKIRARGFNTGKGAKGPNTLGEDSSAWNETPEQKRKRLQDEMMGIAKPAPAPVGPQAPNSRSKKEEDLSAEARAQIVSVLVAATSLQYSDCAAGQVQGSISHGRPHQDQGS
jgi:hypothetical protein